MRDVHMIVRGGFLVPDFETEPIPGGAVALSGPIVAEIGRYRDLRETYPTAAEVGGDRFLVIPGLINGHGHGRGLTSFQRGTGDNTLETWIWGTRKQKAIPVFEDVAFSAARLLRSGVTMTMHNHIVTDPLQYETELEDAVRAYAQAGMRVLFCPAIRNDNLLVYGDDRGFLAGLPGHLRDHFSTSPPEGGFSDKVYIEAVRRLHETHHGPMCRIGFGPLAPQWCTEALLRDVKEEADALKAPVHIHTLETVLQKIYAREFKGGTLIEYLEGIGLLGAGTTLGHCVWPSGSDIRLLARTGTGVTHQPSSNLRLRAGVSPVAEMLREGVRVGLGTDGTTINDNDDLIQEMKVCSLLQRLSSLEPDSPFPTARQIFKMATVNNAALVGCENELGRLEQGYYADLVLLDYEKMCYPYVDPRHDPIEVLLYRGTGDHVDTVVVHGRVVVENGDLLSLDETAIAGRLADVASRPTEKDEQATAAMLDELRRHVGAYYRPWLEEGKLEPCDHVHSRIGMAARKKTREREERP
jgi:cytosine/adenosine deaminase-related metal-dependent hydrolase